MIDGNSSNDGQGKPIDQSSQSTEENDQSDIDKKPLQSNQFADNKDTGKRDNWISQ